jgi:hypothetical protein
MHPSIRRGYYLTQRLYPLEGQRCELCDRPAQVRHHIDGDPCNTDSENILCVCRYCHAALHPEAGNSGNTRLTRRQVRSIRDNRKAVKVIAASMGISERYVRYIRRGERLKTIRA